MKRIVLATWALLAMSSMPAIALAGLSAESARVLKGGGGEEVDIVELKPAAAGDTLVRFLGTGTGLDGMVLPSKHSVDGNHEFYTTSWRGRSFSFVQMDRRGNRWELYAIDDVRRSRALQLDEAATKALKVKDVISQHEKQQKDGTLQKFAAFNRAEEQANHDKQLAESAAEVAKACGGPVSAKINWGSVSDEQLKQYSISSFCSAPLSAMASLCAQAPAAATALKDKIKAVSCTFGAPMKLAVAGGKLEWSVGPDSSNTDEFARKQLGDLEVAPALATKGAEKPPWGDARTLSDRIALSRSAVCADAKGHVVVVAPHAADGAKLYYGDGKKLNRVEVAELLGGGMFFDPRFFNPTANPSFRGADVRLFSSVDFDEEKQTCQARCGTRKSDLKIVPLAEAQAMLQSAEWGAPLATHVPHALVRDDKGIYYFVDKGATPQTQKSFRLFVGPKGNLKLQEMTNVVSDSQGEIFTTKKGELRFIVGPKGAESTWVKGKARTKLLAVPVEENWQMIYNDLGVYTGQRLGTPCDDL